MSTFIESRDTIAGKYRQHATSSQTITLCAPCVARGEVVAFQSGGLIPIRYAPPAQYEHCSICGRYARDADLATLCTQMVHVDDIEVAALIAPNNVTLDYLVGGPIDGIVVLVGGYRAGRVERLDPPGESQQRFAAWRLRNGDERRTRQATFWTMQDALDAVLVGIV